MKDNWEERLACAIACTGCHKSLGPKDLRILSSYTHDPICMDCKKTEEQKPEYPSKRSKNAWLRPKFYMGTPAPTVIITFIPSSAEAAPSFQRRPSLIN